MGLKKKKTDVMIFNFLHVPLRPQCRPHDDPGVIFLFLSFVFGFFWGGRLMVDDEGE
jgi:hypothetical protein